MKRVTSLSVVTLVVGLAAAPAWSKAAPKPPAGRTPAVIDYDTPKAYAKIPTSAGTAATIRKLARPLKGKDADETFRNIHAFMRHSIPEVPEDGWRAEHWDFDRLIQGYDPKGCASHALVFANLARACGIPAVYIKSSRHAWVRKYVSTGETGNFAGHVFLEVHVDGQWRLLDCQGMRVWDTYDPADPELPGGLLAYEKGWDHYAMVHSTRRDDYIREAKARWHGFDVTSLRKNENPGRALLRPAYAVTLGGEWRALSERINGLRSFDRGYWPKRIGDVPGNFFVVTSMGGRVEIPPGLEKDWLPVTPSVLAKEALAGKTDVRTRRRDDGTLVVLVSAPGKAELMQLVWRTDFEALRATLSN